MRLRYFFCLFVLVLSNCKDEDEDKAALIGKWQGDRSEIKATYAGITVREETDENFSAMLEFKEDGTVIFTKDGIENTGTYQRNGNTVVADVQFEFEQMEFDGLSFEIRKLTDSELTLYLETDQEVNHPDLGTATVKVKGTVDFDRL